MHIVTERLSSETLAGLIARQVHGDYVYMYPPRQSYRAFTSDEARRLPGLISGSLRRFPDLNLYVHVPFCRQICGFCNLYAVSGNGRELDGYVDAVLAEARRYADAVDRKSVSTLYLGGGTPSILSARQLERLVTSLLNLFSSSGDIPPETALEAIPLSLASFRRSAGLEWLSLVGFRTWLRVVAGLGRCQGLASLGGVEYWAGVVGRSAFSWCADKLGVA